MEILVDTGVLLRLVIRADPANQETRQAVRFLKARGDKLVAMTPKRRRILECLHPSHIRQRLRSIDSGSGKETAHA